MLSGGNSVTPCLHIGPGCRIPSLTWGRSSGCARWDRAAFVRLFLYGVQREVGNATSALALSTSMRTLGAEVARGRWGRSLVGGSRPEAFPAVRVAVLVCCTALGRPHRISSSGRGRPDRFKLDQRL